MPLEVFPLHCPLPEVVDGVDDVPHVVLAHAVGHAVADDLPENLGVAPVVVGVDGPVQPGHEAVDVLLQGRMDGGLAVDHVRPAHGLPKERALGAHARHPGQAIVIDLQVLPQVAAVLLQEALVVLVGNHDRRVGVAHQHDRLVSGQHELGHLLLDVGLESAPGWADTL